jgi:hypothetical protein
MTPHGLECRYHRPRGACCLRLQSRLRTFVFPHSLTTPKKEEANTSETSVTIYHSPWRHITGERNLHAHHSAKLKLSIFVEAFLRRAIQRDYYIYCLIYVTVSELQGQSTKKTTFLFSCNKTFTSHLISWRSGSCFVPQHVRYWMDANVTHGVQMCPLNINITRDSFNTFPLH